MTPEERDLQHEDAEEPAAGEAEKLAGDGDVAPAQEQESPTRDESDSTPPTDQEETSVEGSGSGEAGEEDSEESDEQLDTLEEIDRETCDGADVRTVEHLEYAAPPKKQRRGKAAREAGATLEIGSVPEARNIIEALLFTTTEPLSVARISKVMNNLHPRTVRGLLLELQMDYEQRAGGLQIVEVAGGFQIATHPNLVDWLLRLHRNRRRNPLTTATLETLAIVAYKQPVTKAELETIRGVDSTATMGTLLDLGLIEVAGRREVIGRPQIYATTGDFLKTFGLRSLADLPSIQELKQLFAQDQKLMPPPAQEASPATEDQETSDGETDVQAEESEPTANDDDDDAEEIDEEVELDAYEPEIEDENLEPCGEEPDPCVEDREPETDETDAPTDSDVAEPDAEEKPQG